MIKSTTTALVPVDTKTGKKASAQKMNGKILILTRRLLSQGGLFVLHSLTDKQEPRASKMHAHVDACPRKIFQNLRKILTFEHYTCKTVTFSYFWHHLETFLDTQIHKVYLTDTRQNIKWTRWCLQICAGICFFLLLINLTVFG